MCTAILALDSLLVNPKIVSERLGHANTGITLDIYSHVLPGMQEAAVEKFDQIFETDASENLEPNVGKMLSNGEGVECRPCRSIGRTKTFSQTFSFSC